MICHGAVSRCITSDSANGSNCGVCSEGTLSASLTEAIWGSPKCAGNWESGCRAYRAPRGPATPNRSRAGPRSNSGGPTRASARCGLRRSPELPISRSPPPPRAGACAPPAQLCGWRRFRVSRPAPPRSRGPDRAPRHATTIATPARARRGGSGPAVLDIAVDQKWLKRTEQQPYRIVGTRTHIVFGRRARSYAIARARSWRRSCLRRARWRARTPASAAPATRRKLCEIFPQPLGRCLAHAPAVHILSRGPQKKRVCRP